jgi:ATP adenylyltransferase
MENHLWTPWRMSYLTGGGPKPDGCIFCSKPQLSDDEAHILYRGDSCYAMLNRYPYNTGHLMIIPYEHVPTLELLECDATCEMMELAKRSITILREAYGPDGFNLGMNLGQSAGAGIAEHVHLHVVARWTGDTNYMTALAQTRVIPEWLDETYTRLWPLFQREDTLP